MSTVSGGIINPGDVNGDWDDVTAPEALSGDTEYRGGYLTNTHASLQLQSSVLWIDSLTASPDTEFDIGLGGAVDATLATIANESTAPASVTFTRPTSKGAGLSVGNVNAGSTQGYWIRRTVGATAAAASDTGSIRWEGDTAP